MPTVPAAAALVESLWCQGRPQGVRDCVLLGGVRLKAYEVVEEAAAATGTNQ